MALWKEEFGLFNHHGVIENEDKLIYNEILDRNVPHEERDGDTTGDCVTRSEVERLVEYIINTVFKVAMRRIATQKVEEAIEHVFTAINKQQKEEIKTPLR